MRRPKYLETTRLGAIFAAGLGAGIWTDLSDIENTWKEDRSFHPQFTRQNERKQWHVGIKLWHEQFIVAKIKTQYSCQSCGYLCAKWLGKCPSCECLEFFGGGNCTHFFGWRISFGRSGGISDDRDSALEASRCAWLLPYSWARLGGS